jgi:hypothetical protein
MLNFSAMASILRIISGSLLRGTQISSLNLSGLTLRKLAETERHFTWR